MSGIRTLVIGVAACAAWGAQAAPADAGKVYSEAQRLGDGFAQVYAELDAEGAPQAIGVSFDPGLLEGLPAMPNTTSRCFDKNGNGRIDDHGECNGDYELRFALPQDLIKDAVTPFIWVGVNWNPMGHPPPAPPVWAVPHYDFHFYIMPREAVRQIRPGACAELVDCDDFKRAQTPVPARYVHADHIDVGAAVPDMGNHLIDFEDPRARRAGPGLHPHLHLRRLRRPRHLLRADDHAGLSRDPTRLLHADQAARGMGGRGLLPHAVLHPLPRRRGALQRVARGFRQPERGLAPRPPAPGPRQEPGAAVAFAWALRARKRRFIASWASSEPSWKVPNHSSSGIEPSA